MRMNSEHNIVVTGGHGFLGNHVVNRLRSRYHNVVALQKQRYDLRRSADVNWMFAELHPTHILHLAATVGGIGFNKDNPATLFYDNAMMGMNIIHYAHLYNVRKVVIVGTVCAYPKFTLCPFLEHELWTGYPEETNAPYGLAKRMLLVQAQAYRQQYGLNSIYLLPTNLYGPGDNFNLNTSHVIPALIRKIWEAKEQNTDVQVWGSGEATREFLYVEDCAEAIDLALQNYDGEQPVNIGSGKSISIKELAELIASIMGYRGQLLFDRSKPDGQMQRELSVDKAKEFGFRATTPFEIGLRRTINWFITEQQKIK